MDVFEAIGGRRSIKKLTDETPPTELIEKLLEAAVVAPNYHDSQPWRFFVLTGEGRRAFGDVLAESIRVELQGKKSEEKIERKMHSARRKPMRAPVIIVVGVKHHADDSPVRRTEDVLAVGAAVQNLLLAAHALGLGALWRTGDAAYDTVVKRHFGLREDDEIAAIVYLGYADPERAGRMKQRDRELSGLTEWRRGEPATV